MTHTSDQDFNKNFLISLGAHVAIALLAFVGGQVVSKIFKNNDIEIIRSAVRVDVVGMPKFTVQELKKMEAEPELPKEPEVAKGEKAPTKVDDEVPDEIKKDDIVIQEQGKEKKKKSSFMSLVSDYSNKKVAAKEKPKGKTSGKSDQDLKALIIEGNRLSSGTALVGEYSDAENSEFSGYVQMLPGVIKPNWKLPSYLLDKDIKCRIKIHLGVAGQLIKLQVVESSGDEEFDKRAQDAIRASAPFPKPSEAVGTRLTNSGIILGFPL